MLFLFGIWGRRVGGNFYWSGGMSKFTPGGGGGLPVWKTL